MIECDELVKIYKTSEVEVMALQGLDLTVEQGELMAIIGKSGSGKSTFLNMVGGLEKPSAGRLYVDGKDLFRMKEEELAAYKQSTVGFVWQKSSRNLFPYLSAVQNVEAPMMFCKKIGEEKNISAKFRRDRALKLLELVGMLHKKDALLSQMSGGEQQRVAIAIALANQPKLLLADEPTGAVDAKTAAYILDVFRRLNEEMGLTIVIVTHDNAMAKKVNRVVMIRDGKISSERIIKESYKDQMNSLGGLTEEDSHDEYSVLDRSGRVQLTQDVLEQAGITGNKVSMSVKDGSIVISKPEDTKDTTGNTLNEEEKMDVNE